MGSREEMQELVLFLIKEGEVFVVAKETRAGRRLFVHKEHAREEDREFTKVWLEEPHFGLDS